MFLAAVGRPRWDALHNRNFSGKIGIFPFTRRVPALRNSRHRAAGTMVTQMVEVHKEVYKEKMLSDVFPAIKRPCGRTRPDAFSSSRTMPRPTTSAMTPTSWLLVQQMGGTSGSSTSLQTAPTLNILDLGFFNSIQSLQDRTTRYTQHGRRAHRRGEEGVRRAGLCHPWQGLDDLPGRPRADHARQRRQHVQVAPPAQGDESTPRWVDRACPPVQQRGVGCGSAVKPWEGGGAARYR